MIKVREVGLQDEERRRKEEEERKRQQEAARKQAEAQMTHQRSGGQLPTTSTESTAMQRAQQEAGRQQQAANLRQEQEALLQGTKARARAQSAVGREVEDAVKRLSGLTKAQRQSAMDDEAARMQSRLRAQYTQGLDTSAPDYMEQSHLADYRARLESDSYRRRIERGLEDAPEQTAPGSDYAQRVQALLGQSAETQPASLGYLMAQQGDLHKAAPISGSPANSHVIAGSGKALDPRDMAFFDMILDPAKWEEYYKSEKFLPGMRVMPAPASDYIRQQAPTMEQQGLGMEEARQAFLRLYVPAWYQRLSESGQLQDPQVQRALATNIGQQYITSKNAMEARGQYQEMAAAAETLRGSGRFDFSGSDPQLMSDQYLRYIQNEADKQATGYELELMGKQAELDRRLDEETEGSADLLALDREVSDLETRRDAWQGMAKEYQDILDGRKKASAYEQLMEEDPEYEAKSAPQLLNLSWGLFGSTGTEAERIHEYILNDEYRAQYLMAGETGGEDPYTGKGYNLMTPEEKKHYSYLWNVEGPEAAQGYLDSITPRLQAIRAGGQSAAWANLATGNALEQAAAWTGARLGNIANAILTPAQYIEALRGNTSPNSQLTDVQRMVETINSAQTQAAGSWFGGAKVPGLDTTWGSMLWQALAVSGADSALAMATGQGLAGMFDKPRLAIAAVDYLFGSNAASTELRKQLDAGAATDKAVFLGLMHGVNEALWEHVSLDKILKGVTPNLGTFLVRAGMIEGSEEVATNLGGRAIDFAAAKMFGGDDPVADRLKQIYLSDKDISFDDAMSQVYTEFGKEDLEAFLSAFISSSVSMGTQAARTQSLGNSIYDGGAATRTETNEAGEETSRAGNAQRIVDFAKAFTEGQESETAKLAADMARRLENGGKVTRWQMGNLMSNLNQEVTDPGARLMLRTLYSQMEKDAAVSRGRAPVRENTETVEAPTAGTGRADIDNAIREGRETVRTRADGTDLGERGAIATIDGVDTEVTIESLLTSPATQEAAAPEAAPAVEERTEEQPAAPEESETAPTVEEQVEEQPEAAPTAEEKPAAPETSEAAPTVEERTEEQPAAPEAETSRNEKSDPNYGWDVVRVYPKGTRRETIAVGQNERLVNTPEGLVRQRQNSDYDGSPKRLGYTFVRWIGPEETGTELKAGQTIDLSADSRGRRALWERMAPDKGGVTVQDIATGETVRWQLPHVEAETKRQVNRATFRVTYKAADGSARTAEVAAADMRGYARDVVGALASYAESTSELLQDTGDGTYRSNKANDILQAWDGQSSAEEYLPGAFALYDSAYTGQEATDAVRKARETLGQHRARMIEDAAKRAASAANKRHEESVKARSGKPGTLTMPEGITPDTMTEETRSVLEYFSALAAESGYNVRLYMRSEEGTADQTANGSFDPETNTLSFAMNGQNNMAQSEYLLATAGHELTHFIRYYNKADFWRQLQNVAISEMRRHGINFEAAVQEHLDTYSESGAPLTYDMAVEETVADALQMIIPNSAAVETIAKENPTLWERMKSFLTGWAQKIRKSFGLAVGYAAESRGMLADGRRYSEQLIQLWDEGLMQAITGRERTERQSQATAEAAAAAQSAGDILTRTDEAMQGMEQEGGEQESAAGLREELAQAQTAAEAAREALENEQPLMEDAEDIREAVPTEEEQEAAQQAAERAADETQRLVESVREAVEALEEAQTLTQADTRTAAETATRTGSRGSAQTQEEAEPETRTRAETVTPETAPEGRRQETEAAPAEDTGAAAGGLHINLSGLQGASPMTATQTAEALERMAAQRSAIQRAQQAVAAAQTQQARAQEAIAEMNDTHGIDERVEGMRQAARRRQLETRLNELRAARQGVEDVYTGMETERDGLQETMTRMIGEIGQYEAPETAAAIFGAFESGRVPAGLTGESRRRAEELVNVYERLQGILRQLQGREADTEAQETEIREAEAALAAFDAEAGRRSGRRHSLSRQENTREEASTETIDQREAEREARYSLREQEETEAQKLYRVSKKEMEARMVADIREWMAQVDESTLDNDEERQYVRQYREYTKEAGDLRTALTASQARAADESLSEEERNRAAEAARILARKLSRAETRLRDTESATGFARLIAMNQRLVQRYVSGKNTDDLRKTSEQLRQAAREISENMRQAQEAVRKAESDTETLHALAKVNSSALKKLAEGLKKASGTTMSAKEIGDMLALSALRAAEKRGSGEERAEDLRADIQWVVRSLMEEQDTGAGYDWRTNNQTRHGATYQDVSNIRINSDVRAWLKSMGMTAREFNAAAKGMYRLVNRETEQAPDQYIEEFGGTEAGVMSGHDVLDRMWEMIEARDSAQRVSLRDMMSPQEYDAMWEDMEGRVLDAVTELMTQRAKPDAALVEALLKTLDRKVAAEKQVSQRLEAIQGAAGTAEDMTARVDQAAEMTQGEIAKIVLYYNQLATIRRMEQMAGENQQAQRIVDSPAAQNAAEQLERLQERVAQDRAYRERAEANAVLLRRLERSVKRLNRRLIYETDRDNVPEQMKGYAEALMQMVINYDLQGTYHLVFDSSTAARLLPMYQALESLDGDFGSFMYSEEMEQSLSEIANLIAQYQGIRGVDAYSRQMKAELRGQVLEDLCDAFSNALFIIDTERNVFLNGRATTISNLAGEVGAPLRARENYKGDDRGMRGAARQYVDWGNTTAPYAQRRYGNAGLDTLFGGIYSAESENGLRKRQAAEKMQAIREQYHVRDWDGKKGDTLDWQTESGRTITVNRQQALYAWATWKREHQDGTLIQSKHMETGGVVMEQDPKKKRDYSDTAYTGTPITPGDMAQLESWLTEEQKGYADAMVAFMSQDLSEWGNAVSLQQYGIKKYKEKYYFPFVTYQGNLKLKSTAGSANMTDDNRLAHKGFTKRRLAYAQNAVVLGSFDDAVAKHADEMIAYSTFAPNIEIFNAVLNSKILNSSESGETTIRNMIEQKYGKNAQAWLMDWLRDIQGGMTRDKTEQVAAKFLSKFKKGAVMNSMSVAMQQPLSYLRAATAIRARYLTAALTRMAHPGQSYEQAMRYAGTAVHKEIGGFDIGMGQSAADWMLGRQEAGVMGRIDDVAGFLPHLMDKVTWAAMWEAVKLEQAAAHPEMDPNSEAFLQMCGKRFDEVMRLTQVYDSTIVKSPNMRSNSLYMKMVTAFMNEPTISLNVLKDAAWGALHRKEGGEHVRLAAAAMTFLLSAVAQAMAKGLWTTGRKKDEDKTFFESFTQKFTAYLAGELNPIELIPGVKDIWEIINGEGVDRTDLSVVSEVVTQADKLMQLLTGAKTFADQYGEGTEGIYSAIENMGGSIAKMFGIPLKNIMRDLRATWNMAGLTGAYAGRESSEAVLLYSIRDAVLGEIPHTDKLTSVTWYYGAYYQALKAGKTAEAGDLLEYLSAGKGKSESAIATGLKTAMKADISSGGLPVEDAVRILMYAGAYTDEKKAYEWAVKQTGEDVGQWTELDEAARSGRGMKETIRTMTEHGYTQEQIGNHIRDSVDDWYKAGEVSREQAEKLLTEYGGAANDTEAERHWTLKEWDAKKAHEGEEGYKYTKYEGLYAAIDSGRGLGEALAELKAYYTGGDPDKYAQDVARQLTQVYKPQLSALLKAGKKKEAAELQARLLSAYEALGYDRSKKLKEIQKWYN